jgi:hypothetical protein
MWYVVCSMTGVVFKNGGICVKTYVIDVYTSSRTPEEGAQSLRWPNDDGFIILLLLLLYEDMMLSY